MNSDLANLVNMAAVKAAVDGIDKITTKQLEFAKDKLLMGTERKSMALTEESRKVNQRLCLFLALAVCIVKMLC